jgi:hypothetical protein
MPLYFWNDPDGSKYRGAYFDVFPGVWRHGDYVLIHPDTGGVTFYGRSDAVLKPSGVRIGTAEIYALMEKVPEIADSLAVGRVSAMISVSFSSSSPPAWCWMAACRSDTPGPFARRLHPARSCAHP